MYISLAACSRRCLGIQTDWQNIQIAFSHQEIADKNHSILFIARKETGPYDFRSINFMWSLGPYAFKSVTTKFSGKVLVSPTGAETKTMSLLQFFKNIVIWMKILDFSKYLMNELRHKVKFVHVIIQLKVISVGCDQAHLRLSKRLFSLISIES